MAAALIIGIVWGRAPRRPPPPNVLVVLVDTLRADRLGAAGRVPSITPFLDRYGDASLVFQRAYAPSAWTIPSVISLFVGQRPFEHGLTDFGIALPAGQVTLTEVLAEEGFDTAGFLATGVMTNTGFERGFRDYQVVGTAAILDPTDATQVNATAFDWIDRRSSGAPFFLYLHYLEPHWPYRVHPGLTPPRPNILVDDASLGLAAIGTRIADPVERQRSWSLAGIHVKRLRDLYDGEVAYLDQQLAALFAGLEQRGALANTIVVITADHGEELGEHEIYGHGDALYETLIRVPLVVHLPGGGPTGRIERPVETAGLAAALLHAVGVVPPPSFRVPPIPLADTDATKSDPPVSQLAQVTGHSVWLHRTAAIDGDRKLLIAHDGTPEVYDLHRDRKEVRPLPPDDADLARAAAIDRFDARPDLRKVSATDLADDVKAQLRALGYLDAPGVPSAVTP